ncbi:histidine kinase 1 isoform X1 [Arachis hypogaea]|uniref:histidine kinase 1 isoform X1 n=2 Tax=Arachis hypogaea TaxID=3818 RepID=UPI0007AF502B|nr:histidine kinase 1 isoform X2 [Arachis hypogaea]
MSKDKDFTDVSLTFKYLLGYQRSVTNGKLQKKMNDEKKKITSNPTLKPVADFVHLLRKQKHLLVWSDFHVRDGIAIYIYKPYKRMKIDARRKAEASSNSQFLANMSHELRTPMAAIIGLLDILMSNDCLTNEQCATVTQIRKCSTALLRLLNNILDLSKVESGKLVLEDAEFNLGRELERLVDMYSLLYAKHINICHHVILYCIT